jgi:hypothetical protein
MSKLGTRADSDVMLDPCSDSITCGVSTLTVTGASCTDSLRCRAAVTTISLSSFSSLEAFSVAPLSGLDLVVGGATPGGAAAESFTFSAPAGEMAAKPIDATSAAINLIVYSPQKSNFPSGGNLVVI